MLLQIQEPNETLPQGTEGEIAIGIDLGTTNSVIAFSKDHKPFILKKDEFDSGIIPSIVAYGPDHHVVGQEAVSQEGYHGIKSVKRLMGQRPSTLKESVETKLFNFVPDHLMEESLKFQAGNHVLTPIDTSADILRFLKEKAEFILGKPVTKAVITVPAYFSERARVATRNAAKIAGLHPLRLLSEPTAAAVAYGLDGHEDGVYAIYDLGGGTFDFSVLRFEKGIFQVLATGGDTHLGGDDLDYVLAKEILNQLGKSIETLEGLELKNILHDARRLKEEMSHREQEAWLFELEGKQHQISLNLADLDQLFHSLIYKTFLIVENVLKDAEVTSEQIHQVILVGGSTKSPIIQTRVKEFFQKDPLCSLNPEEVVALGAAIQAEALTQGANHLLLDVTPLSLGIEIMGDMVEHIIPRNTPIPVSHTQEFTTYQDNQNGLTLHIVQGESKKVQECRSLGRFSLKGIPPMPAGLPRIAITYTLDADGLLSITATEKSTEISQHIEINPSYGLDFEKMSHLLTSGDRSDP